jgi:hypothetical protein
LTRNRGVVSHNLEALTTMQSDDESDCVLVADACESRKRRNADPPSKPPRKKKARADGTAAIEEQLVRETVRAYTDLAHDIRERMVKKGGFGDGDSLLDIAFKRFMHKTE